MDLGSPDGRTQKEIDYFITDNKGIFEDVIVLNRSSTGSDHRMISALYRGPQSRSACLRL